eukprot:Anaeramoba_ignava/a354843_5.p1 GENE.a354843_5~~a354843_5.p1  ORF type:complete len:116 (-),score=5.32 a354843_5:275-622(-)
MKTKEDIYHSIEALKDDLITSSEIDDVVIDGLTTLNRLRNLYKEDRSLFDSHLIRELQDLKKSIESVDECFELIYDDHSKYNCKQLEKIRLVIPQNEYLLSLIDEKIKQFEEDQF